MKTLFGFIATIVAVTIINGAMPPANAAAMDMSKTVTIGDLSVTAAWSRASAGMKRAGAAFMTITNSGTADDRLIAASTPAAKRTELHTHLMEDGVMKMRQVPHIDIAAGKTVQLKPGGLHVMMFRLTEVFEEGHHYPLQLTFEKAGQVTLMVHVGKAGAMGKMKHGDHMKHEGQMKHGDDMRHKCMEMMGEMKKRCMDKIVPSDN